jgi:hypothetical protein
MSQFNSDLSQKAIQRVLDAHIRFYDIDDAVGEEPLSSLDPIEGYVLVSLLKHERRQKWVGYLVESRLRGDGAQLARFGAFGHPEGIEQQGDVPGETDWRYFFHGRGCCFTHEDGTEINVDFADDGSALEIDPYFYQNYLRSATMLEWCERQLLAPDGLEEWWQLAVPGLVGKGSLVQEYRIRFTEQGRCLAESLELLMDTIRGCDLLGQSYLLARLGDYERSLLALSGTGADCPALSFKAKSQFDARELKLRRRLKAVEHGSTEANRIYASLLRSATFESAAYFRPALLRRPITGTNHVVLAGLRRMEGSQVTELICDAFLVMTHESFIGRIRRAVHGLPGGPELPWFALVVGLVDAALERQSPGDQFAKFRAVVPGRLKGDFGASDGEAAFLLYLLNSSSGIQKLRQALSHRVPMARMDAAAFLALIGSKQALDTLLDVAAKDPASGGHEAACALSLIERDEAKRAAADWNRQHDGYEDLGEGESFQINGRTFPNWNMNDIMRSGLRSSIEHGFITKRKQYAPLLRKWNGEGVLTLIKPS